MKRKNKETHATRYVEKVVEKIVEVPTNEEKIVEKIIEVEKIVEKIIEVEKFIEVPASPRIEYVEKETILMLFSTYQCFQKTTLLRIKIYQEQAKKHT